MSSIKDRIAAFEHTDAATPLKTAETSTTSSPAATTAAPLPSTPAVVLQAKTTEIVEEAPIVELDLKEATLAKETIIKTQTDVIQPVVLRDVLKTEVHQIEQPILEAETLPVQHHQRTLPEQSFESNQYQKVEDMALPQAAHIETETEVQRVMQQPIVQERIHHKIVEQIQPIVYREIVQPHETLVVQPIYEKYTEKAEVIHHVAAPLHSLAELEAQVKEIAKSPNTIKHESAPLSGNASLHQAN